MAKLTLTQATYDVDNIQSEADQVKGEASRLKEAFDKTGLDAKTYNNSTLLTQLQSETANVAGANAIGTEGTFGASNVGDELKAVKVVTDAETANRTEADEVLQEQIDLFNSDEISHKNYLINGNFDVWQRGASFASISDGVEYTVDRFKATALATSQLTISRVESDLEGSKYNIKIVRVGTVGAELNFGQYIEDAEVLAGKTLTLSFMIKALVATTISLGIFGDGNVIHQPTGISIGTSWSLITTTFTMPTTKYSILEVRPIRGVGDQNTDYTIEIAQAKLELGSVYTPFVPNTYTEELRDCQRYYVQYNNGGYPISVITTGTANTLGLKFNLPQPMRVKPTLTGTYNFDIRGYGTNYAINSSYYSSILQPSDSSINLSTTALGGGANTGGYGIIASSGEMKLDAEL